MQITQYCDIIDKQLVIRSRVMWKDVNSRWYALIEGAEIKDGVCLCSMTGNGSSPDEALADLARAVGNRRLVFAAADASRREEFNAPELEYGD